MEFSSNCTSHKSRRGTGWLYEHSSDFSVINWLPRSPDLNLIDPFWDVLEQGVKGYHTASTNLTDLWTALANIWQFIPVERFQKLVESMPRRVAAVIKARGDPTRYKIGVRGFNANQSQRTRQFFRSDRNLLPKSNP
ncbi:transposable element Tcb2 transposase [Trichonephila clavipes]|nr:transposable element Tcb2 transposase [Trichonephila clavipes]